jgi:hypothetical protein
MLALLLSMAAIAQAQIPPSADQPLREIFVPFEDLNIILESDKQRVFLTRQEYDDLVKQAKAKPQSPAPHKILLSSAEYDGQLQDGRALISGQLTVEVLEDGLFALPLELGGVGIRAATLDGKPAPLSKNENHQPIVLIQGKGTHKLTLQLMAPLQTAAAQQTLNVTLPTNAATRLKLTVPGNIDVKSGGAVISRTYEMEANRTQLEVLPQRGGLSLVMSLNNRLLQDERVFVARSVIVDEVTQGYERIHATVSFRILHGAVEKFRLGVPAGFEVTRVESTLLARWEEKADAAGAKTLEATLREPTSEQVVLQITANRSPAADADWLASLQDWKFPQLTPLDTAGNVAVLGLLVEDRLRPEKIAATNLLSIDSQAILGAIPASVLAAEPGAPTIRQVVSYYAPAGEYGLSASFARPPAGLKVAGNSLLVIGDQGLTLQGGFALSPQAESLYGFAFAVPAGWQVTQVTAADGAALPIERYPIEGGGTRISVRLPSGIGVGQTQTINYQALHTPAGWLADWQAQKVAFPKLAAENATDETGAIAVQTLDDLVVRPDSAKGLVPLLDNEKASFGLADIPTALAYRYESRDYELALSLARTSPSLAAEVISFFRLDRDNLIAHYELSYDVREARTRTLVFSLDKNTPTEISIRGLDGVLVKEFEHDDSGTWRRWTVQLAERHIGRVRLAVDFQQRYEPLALARFGVPLIQAEEVEFQSAFFAVEGDPELEIAITTPARTVDPGELAGADYAIGKRLLGAFGYVGSRPSTALQVSRREAYMLPPALIQRAELVTKVSAAAGRKLADGTIAPALAQSVARYDLLTKATLLEIRLPAGSELWTVYLDNQPTKPQIEGDSLLLSLPAQQRVAIRKLQIVYESPSQSLGFSGTVEAVAPTLLVRATGTDAEREIPQADLQWQLILPSGYQVRSAGGTVFTNEIPEREMAALKVAAFLYELSGGIRPWYAVGAKARHEAGDDMSAISGSFSAVEGIRPKTENSFDAGGMPPPTATPPIEAMTAPMAERSDRPAEAPQASVAESAPAPQTPEPAPAMPAPGIELLRTPQPQTTETQAEQVQVGNDFEAKGKYWALEGVSSLRIDIQADSAPATTFVSLGEQPRLEASVIDRRRLDAAACGLASLVLLVGAGLTFRPARQKAAYVIVVLLASTVPLLLTTAFDEVGQVFDYVFYAGCLLIPYYLLAALTIRIFGWARSKVPADCCPATPAVQQIVAILALVSVLGLGSSAAAQEPADKLPESVRITNLKDILPLLEGEQAPVAVPADAVIVPYDPEKPLSEVAGQKLLVPYAKYVELWNLAHPDKKLEAATPPPAQYAIAGTAYEATLASGDFLALVGKLEIDVFTDKPIAVPLALAGGVLEKATVDGQPARLQVVEASGMREHPGQAANPQPAEPNREADASRSPNAGGLPPRMLLLHLSGKGRKSVQLNIRLGLSRQGGWRIVHGQLPVGPAAALTLMVPGAGTEVRLANVADKAEFDTTADNEKIETTLFESGLVDVQWRPKVAEGMVDTALTAQSLALFDVREDALRLVWQVRLEFGRAFRDSFSLTAPADYLVEQVSGDNVRGWTAKPAADRQRIDVTLLKPAQGSETLTLHLAKRGRVGEGELAEFDAPSILVDGAALEQGEIAVRRSPRLELRSLGAVGLSRADSGEQTQALAHAADTADAAVLLVKPFQNYRFVKPPFRLTLAAVPALQETTAEIKAALQVAERGTTLDAAITFRPQGQPLYRVRLYLPEGFSLDRLGPTDLEWAITTENGRQLLTVQLIDGRTEAFTLTLFGKIAAPKPMGPVEEGAAATEKTEGGTGGTPVAPRSVALPKIEVLDVQKQEGEIVVLPDPDTDVRAENLKNAEASPLTSGPGWMKAEQQRLAKSVIRYRTADYAATLVLTPRTPIIAAQSITNVKITPQAIQETISIGLQIDQAGIRELSFLVPERMAKARLADSPGAKLVQRKIIEPATDAEGQPVQGMVRIRLLLQDYVQDKFGITLELDRLLEAKKQPVPIPVIETGRVDRQLVVIENVGRDELVIDELDVVGLEPINPQSQAWRELVGILGADARITQAFAVIPNLPRRELTFSTQQGQKVVTADARIHLATTMLIVDEAGAYRGLQEYRVTNGKEQFLEIELPAGAGLWTATVAGEPVKPAETTPPQTGVVRIPLVKTAEGEGDYVVQLKYGGQMEKARLLNSVSFPLLKTRNINVELSRVYLHLPERREWFDFRGTMRLVEDASELEKGFQGYLNKRIEEATRLLSSGDDYTKARAWSNLKQARILLEDNRRIQSGNNVKQLALAIHDYHDVHQLEARNEALLNQAEQQAQAERDQQQVVDGTDNRGRLNNYWNMQDLKRSKNVVSDLGSNFDADAPADQTPATGKELAFNKDWLEQNSLRTGDKGDASAPGRPGMPEDQSGGGRQGGRFFRGEGKPITMDEREFDGKPGGGQKAPEIAAKQQRDVIQQQLQKEESESKSGESQAGEQLEKLQRYQERLDQSVREQQRQPSADLDLSFQQQGQFGGTTPTIGGFDVPGGSQPARGQGGGMMNAGGANAAGGPAGPPADPSGRPFVTSVIPVIDNAQSMSQVAAGLASLDVALPERGRVYSFITPRGELEIEARSIPLVAIGKLIGLGGVLIAILIVWALGRERSRGFWRGLFASRAFTIGLIVLGLFCFLFGLFPYAGVALLVAGITLAIHHRLNRPASAAATAA